MIRSLVISVGPETSRRLLFVLSHRELPQYLDLRRTRAEHKDYNLAHNWHSVHRLGSLSVLCSLSSGLHISNDKIVGYLIINCLWIASHTYIQNIIPFKSRFVITRSTTVCALRVVLYCAPELAALRSVLHNESRLEERIEIKIKLKSNIRRECLWQVILIQWASRRVLCVCALPTRDCSSVRNSFDRHLFYNQFSSVDRNITFSPLRE